MTNTFTYKLQNLINKLAENKNQYHHIALNYTNYYTDVFDYDKIQRAVMCKIQWVAPFTYISIDALLEYNNISIEIFLDETLKLLASPRVVCHIDEVGKYLSLQNFW